MAVNSNSSPLRIKRGSHHQETAEVDVQQQEGKNDRSEIERKEEEYRIRRLQEDSEYIERRRREADMMCTKVDGSTMAETKEPHTHKRGEGPVKAYDLPRQIEDNGLNKSSSKKR